MKEEKIKKERRCMPEFMRLLQFSDPMEHISQSKTSEDKDKQVRGVLGVNVDTMKTGDKIKAYLGHFFGQGELVTSSSSDTVWYVPKKSRDAFFDRYKKANPDSKFTGSLVEFIRQNEKEIVYSFRESLRGTTGVVAQDTLNKLKDFTYSAGPVRELMTEKRTNTITYGELRFALKKQAFFMGARSGNLEDQYKLGKSYGYSDNYEKAFEWFKKAAEKGFAKAQFKLSLLYENGNVPGKGEDTWVQSKEEASKWLAKAAEGGYAKAQIKLAEACESAAKDETEQPEILKLYQEAVKWYTKAAEPGNIDVNRTLAQGEVQKKLAQWYEKGCEVDGVTVVKKSAAQAFKWYHVLAERGDAAAPSKLSDFYRTGIVEEGKTIVPKSLEEAAQWLKISESQFTDEYVRVDDNDPGND